MTRVSVLIPAYKAPLTIRRAVRSALGQQGVDVECIVVDDCSPDNTGTLAEQAGATVIRHQANGGTSKALNTAAANASGEYLLPLAADDWLAGGALEALASALNADPSVGFTYGQTHFWGRRHDVYTQPEYGEETFYYHNASMYAVMLRRTVWDEGCRWLDMPEFSGVEDWDFILQMIDRGYSGRMIPAPVLNYVYWYGTQAASKDGREGAVLRWLCERHPRLLKARGYTPEQFGLEAAA